MVELAFLSAIVAFGGDQPDLLNPARTRASFGPGGPTLLESGIAVSLSAWGREGAPIAADRVAPVATDRLEYRRLGLVEWWVERADGLEQGFTLASPPRGDGPLVFDLAIRGAVASLSPGGDGVDLRATGGQRVQLGALSAVDSLGRELPAWMEATPTAIRLLVDDAGAVGAVTVDPLLSAAEWVVESNAVGVLLGESVAGAGDIDGDGYDDVLVGTPEVGGGGIPGRGRASLYAGSSAGLGAAPVWEVESAQAYAFLGVVASAGDVNGDGFDDVAIGAPNFDHPEPDEGIAYVYLGSAAGLGALPAWSAEPNMASAAGGAALSSAGDVDGDGLADLLMGAPTWPFTGRAYLYLGTPAGPEAAPDWTANGPGGSFGVALSSAGDVNGDGYDDAAVGAPYCYDGSKDEGCAYLYLGSASGLSHLTAWAVEADQADDRLGTSVSAAGDVDGDGYGDLVVGVPDYRDVFAAMDGAAFLYLGSSTGLGAAPAAILTSGQISSVLGDAVVGAGDMNGDGFDDVAAGAPFFSNGQASEGRIFLNLGSSGGWVGAPLTAEPNRANSGFGLSLARAGDVDADGYDDLLVGAPFYDDGQKDEGSAWLFAGSCFDPDADADADGIGDRCDVCAGYDDASDPDLDGVPDGCDACPGYDDRIDADHDTVPDDCDDCPSDADIGQLDTDGDGVGNACDVCPEADDLPDADLDLVPDDCDLCPGYDDRLDADLDAVPDACDACPLVIDPYQLDGDADGAGDACDLCPGFDDGPDADLDLVPDDCDACPGFDDRLDPDGDGDPEDCDACPGYDDGLDADHDLVPDGCDRCAGFDDAVDLDLDGAPDGCDPCPSGGDAEDLDGDGVARCAGDCWDANPAVHPGAIELADGIDQDCDRAVDEGTRWHDDDGDGSTEDGGDCDDLNPEIHPGAEEVCDGVDQDCDGVVDQGTECFDDDQDGFSEREGDCDDAAPAIFPGATEILTDGVDNDCDGLTDPGAWDADGDGWITGDCSPEDPLVSPGSPEIENGVDDNCDGRIDDGTPAFDGDGDGFSPEDGDCNDEDPGVFPGAPEVVDGRDHDCDGRVDELPATYDTGEPEPTSDLDKDGWTSEDGDCNDRSGWANPEQAETCDGIDNDCDGLVDEDCGPEARPAAPVEPRGCGCDASGDRGGGALVLLVALVCRRSRVDPLGRVERPASFRRAPFLW
jgi:hypothetical protein